MTVQQGELLWASWVSQHQSGRRKVEEHRSPQEKGQKQQLGYQQQAKHLPYQHYYVNGIKYFKEKSCTKAVFPRPEHIRMRRFPPADAHTLPGPQSLNPGEVFCPTGALSHAAAVSGGCCKSLWGQTSFCGPMLPNTSTANPSPLGDLWVQLPAPHTTWLSSCPWHRP